MQTQTLESKIIPGSKQDLAATHTVVKCWLTPSQVLCIGWTIVKHLDKYQLLVYSHCFKSVGFPAFSQILLIYSIRSLIYYLFIHSFGFQHTAEEVAMLSKAAGYLIQVDLNINKSVQPDQLSISQGLELQSKNHVIYLCYLTIMIDRDMVNVFYVKIM